MKFQLSLWNAGTDAGAKQKSPYPSENFETRSFGRSKVASARAFSIACLRDIIPVECLLGGDAREESFRELVCTGKGQAH